MPSTTLPRYLYVFEQLEGPSGAKPHQGGDGLPKAKASEVDGTKVSATSFSLIITPITITEYHGIRMRLFTYRPVLLQVAYQKG